MRIRTLVRPQIAVLTVLGALAWSPSAMAQAPAPAPAPVPAQPQNQGPLTFDEHNPRKAMRDLIIKIGKFFRGVNPQGIIMTMGGLNLVEQVDVEDATRRSPLTSYMRAIDGIVVRNLHFRPPHGDNTDTRVDDQTHQEMLRLATLAQRYRVKIWVTDYAEDKATANRIFDLNSAKGFVPFPVMDPIGLFDVIPDHPRRPFKENHHNIVGIKNVENFLMMTDSGRYDTSQHFVHALANTNYDAVIVDVYHRGRHPLTKEDVQSLKFKKIGSRRLVLAHMNIAQAESHRHYWQSNWQPGNPAFIATPVQGAPDKYHVKYWYRAWQDLITDTPDSYVYGISQLGFDGIVLDGVEGYQVHETTE
jgi:cysteinyl-tRNA synthetase